MIRRLATPHAASQRVHRAATRHAAVTLQLPVTLNFGGVEIVFPVVGADGATTLTASELRPGAPLPTEPARIATVADALANGAAIAATAPVAPTSAVGQTPGPAVLPTNDANMTPMERAWATRRLRAENRRRALLVGWEKRRQRQHPSKTVAEQ